MKSRNFKIGDKVDYLGYFSHEPPQKNCIITDAEDASGGVFNGPCYTLDKVKCWVSRGEIKAVEQTNE